MLDKNLLEFHHQKKTFFKLGLLLRILKIVNYFVSFIRSFRNLSVLSKKLVFLIKSLNSRTVFSSKDIIFTSQLIDDLYNSKKSLIRWGDGETFFYLGEGNFHQVYDKDLKNKLHKIIYEYNENSEYLLALPLTPLLSKNSELFFSGYFIFWYKTRYLLSHIFKSKVVTIYDAFCFRFESSILNFDIIKLWKGYDLILVANDQDIFERLKILNKNNTNFFIKIKAHNAYDDYDSILKSILELSNNMLIDNLRIILSGGVTAKVLAYELSQKKIICYDLGNYFNFKFLENMEN